MDIVAYIRPLHIWRGTSNAIGNIVVVYFRTYSTFLATNNEIITHLNSICIKSLSKRIPKHKKKRGKKGKTNKQTSLQNTAN